MFFVHGGGYLFGSSATGIYDGAALARRGCVYVSANYRLGALGCVDLSSLSTESVRSRAICSCAIWSWRWNGWATTLPPSAVTPAMSRSSARAPVPMPWRPCSRCLPRAGSSTG